MPFSEFFIYRGTCRCCITQQRSEAKQTIALGKCVDCPTLLLPTTRLTFARSQDTSKPATSLDDSKSATKRASATVEAGAKSSTINERPTKTTEPLAASSRSNPYASRVEERVYVEGVDNQGIPQFYHPKSKSQWAGREEDGERRTLAKMRSTSMST